MLEAIRERGQGLFAKIILGLITIPFALWGVESYLQFGGEVVVAKVGDDKVTREEFIDALKERQDRIRQAMGVDAGDSPEVRQMVVDELIARKVLLGHAREEGLIATDEVLAAVIAQEPEFQEGGRFSQKKYELALRRLNLSPQAFEQRLRQDVVFQQMSAGVGGSLILPGSVVDRVIRIGEQKREVARFEMNAEELLAQVKVEPQAVRAYYDSHLQEFAIPEMARFEYVVLSGDVLAQKVEVSEEEIRKAYAENAARYGSAEERKAGHILIAVAEDAPAAEVAAAQKQAEQLLAQVQKQPDSFAALAKKSSQDPGSAPAGGDLGFFARGVMAKPFEEAVFAMKAGEIRGPVRSPFGFHVIRLAEVRAGKSKSLEEVREELLRELKKQKSARKFAESAEAFGNTVYEQGDSLQPAAKAFGLTVQQTGGWIQRAPVQGAPFNHEKLLKAAFSDDVLRQKRNSEAVEVAPNTLVSVRLIEHKPAANRPFDEVSAGLTQKLLRDKAIEELTRRGEAMLAELRQGKVLPAVKWSESVEISRQQPKGLDAQGLERVFKAGTGKLPAHAGGKTAKGFTLYRISRVSTPENIDAAARKTYGEQIRQAMQQEVMAAYLESLKRKTKTEIIRAQLEAKN